MTVLRKLDTHRPDVGKAVPVRLSSFRVETFVSNTSQDACAFCERPDAVVLQSGNDVHHVHLEDARGNVELLVLFGEESVWAEVAGANQEGEDPSDTGGHFHHGWSAASRNPSLLPGWGSFGWIGTRRQIEHGCLKPATVIRIIESRSSH